MISRPSADAGTTTSQLLDNGFCILRGLVEPDLVAAISDDLAGGFQATPRSQGAFYGEQTRRFHGLLRRSVQAERFVLDPLVMQIVEAILGPHCDMVQLNLTQAIEIEPGSDAQPPHRDQDMWPVHSPGVEYLVNVMWPFMHYTALNGATLIWPGSHRRQDEVVISETEAIAAEMAPGDALIFLGSTLHSGGANRSSEPRRGMIISYSLGWLKPYELPWLAYPPECARMFSKDLAALAGYRAHRPNLGTYEGRCPSSLLESDPGTMGAVDSLRHDQEELIAAWRAGHLLSSPRGDAVI